MNPGAGTASAEESHKRGLGFLLGGVIACLLVAICSAVAAVGITFQMLSTLPPDPTNSIAFQAGAVGRAPLFSAIALWAMCWATFWRLSSMRASLFGLAILIAVGFAVAIPVRLSLAPSLSGNDRIAVNLIQTTTSQVEETVAAAREDLERTGANTTPPEWTRELVEARAATLQQVVLLKRATVSHLESIRRTSVASISSAQVSENTLNLIVQQLQWVIGSSPSVVEVSRAELLVLEKAEEQASYLSHNASGWDVQNGQIVFRSERVSYRFQQLNEQLQALAATAGETTRAMEARRQTTLASSPFNSTPRLFESLSGSSVEQINRVALLFYLFLQQVVTSVAAAAVVALLAAPIVKISAKQVTWRRILVIGFRSFLPAFFGITLTYAIYVLLLGRQPFETPALLLMAWFVLGGWLISRAMKKEGVTHRFPGIGTRVIVGLLILSWILAGLVFGLGWLTSLDLFSHAASVPTR